MGDPPDKLQTSFWHCLSKRQLSFYTGFEGVKMETERWRIHTSHSCWNQHFPHWDMSCSIPSENPFLHTPPPHFRMCFHANSRANSRTLKQSASLRQCGLTSRRGFAFFWFFFNVFFFLLCICRSRLLTDFEKKTFGGFQKQGGRRRRGFWWVRLRELADN